MTTKLFSRLFTAVVAGAVTLGASTLVHASPQTQEQSVQDQDMQKPSPDVYPPPDQGPPPEQAAPQPEPQYAAPQPQYQDQAPQYPEQAPPPDQGQAPNQQQYSPLSAEQLQQLVAPIALYPDALVAQILSAAAYPTQIVEAHRFMQENPNLKGHALGDAVDQQDWDPSVKALCQFPSVLANMDRDLSWTSEIGNAYYNQSDDIMQAIQYMRHKAEAAGNLRTTQQQRVYDRDDQVQIEPADPQVVYVPQYNPAYVYGYPVGLWPGFSPWWGFGGPYISFGFGFPIAPFFGFGWGWHGWGIGWGFHGGVFFGGRPYAWHSGAFYNHNAFVHGNYRGFARGGFAARGFAGRGYASRGYTGNRGYAGTAGNRSYAGNRGYASNSRSFAGNNRGYAGNSRGYEGNTRGYAGVNRGYASRPSTGMRSGAFGGHNSGGATRGYSSRGSSGFSGGRSGGGHSGGGGGHSGGGHGR